MSALALRVEQDVTSRIHFNKLIDKFEAAKATIILLCSIFRNLA